jgi:hypothetical protein
MADIFNSNAPAVTIETPASVLEGLVGEGKKFRDPESLAKGKLEADNHIKNLEQEMQQLRADLAARKTVEDQIQALQASKVVPNSPAATPAPVAPGQVAFTEDDLNKRIKAITEQTKQEEATRSNVETVAGKLIALYGSEQKAAEAVEAKAKELNVSKKFLESTAAHSPAAFFSLIGVKGDNTLVPGSAAPRSDVNTGAFTREHTFNNPAPDTYEGMRAAAGNNVKNLLDPAYLRKSHDLAMKNPEKFFGSSAA